MDFPAGLQAVKKKGIFQLIFGFLLQAKEFQQNRNWKRVSNEGFRYHIFTNFYVNKHATYEFKMSSPVIVPLLCVIMIINNQIIDLWMFSSLLKPYFLILANL